MFQRFRPGLAATLLSCGLLASAGVPGRSDGVFPPQNPWLANSPWPMYHHNTYAQASTPLRGPEPGDKLDIQVVPTRFNGASPWSNLSEPYSDGSHAMWGSTVTYVYKVLARGQTWKLTDAVRLTPRASIKWNNLLLRGNRFYVTAPDQRAIYRLGDAQPGNPDSKIEVKAIYRFPPNIPGACGHFSVTYDGWLIVITRDGYMGAVKHDFSDAVFFDLKQNKGDVNYHNAFPIDEQGNIYLASQQALTKIHWDASLRRFSRVWRAPYSFRDPSCNPESRGAVAEVLLFLSGAKCSGSGTTPTLMGVGDMDKLLVTVDGHFPRNNLVAFWREDIPPDWKGLPGQDRRVAAIAPLPYATSAGAGFNTENSPVVYGYEVGVAQYSGLFPRCNPVPGVQKLRWNPRTRRLDLVWANGQVALNNVLTYSRGSNLVYGSGRKNCVYHFYGLDWNTGRVALDIPLGNDSIFLDSGNQVSILPDRSAIYGGGSGHVRIRPRPAEPDKSR